MAICAGGQALNAIRSLNRVILPLGDWRGI